MIPSGERIVPDDKLKATETFLDGESKLKRMRALDQLRGVDRGKPKLHWRASGQQTTLCGQRYAALLADTVEDVTCRGCYVRLHEMQP